MVAGCKHISSKKGREDGELFKLMSLMLPQEQMGEK